MYQSLHSILTPLREKQATGTLSLEHRDGQKVMFSLLKGSVISCLNGKKRGGQAAKLAATWLDFNSDFHEGVISEEDDTLPVDQNYFDILDGIDLRVQEYRRVIPHNEIRFQLKKPAFQGEIEFKGYELKVAILLDGTRTVEQVVIESGISEFLVLSAIYKLYDLDLVAMVAE